MKIPFIPIRMAKNKKTTGNKYLGCNMRRVNPHLLLVCLKSDILILDINVEDSQQAKNRCPL